MARARAGARAQVSAIRYLAAWTLIALLFAGQSLMVRWREGRSYGVGVAILSSLQYWYLWALLGLLIIPLARRFPITRTNWPRRMLLHMGLAVLFATSHVLLRALTNVLLWGDAFNFAGIFVEQAHLNIVVYGALLGIVHALMYHNISVQQAATSAQLESSLTRARLDALSAQLEPHFMFNTLQAASSLVYTSPAEAEAVLLQLSELLRRVLRVREAQYAPLRDELDFLDRYIQILRARFGERLRYEARADEALMNARIPSLLLQPLVENAIEHGIARRPGPGAIRVSATRNGDRLILAVTDDGPGFRAGAPAGGVGLNNTRERLQQLYGDQHEIRFDDAASGGLVVTISIPFQS
jgi:two-component system LytT family sensor kinase